MSDQGINNASESANTTTRPSGHQRPKFTRELKWVTEGNLFPKKLPEKRHISQPTRVHILASNAEETVRIPTSPLTSDERKAAYAAEKKSRLDNNAFHCVSRTNMPQQSNEIWSHVEYKRKPVGSAEARIAPWSIAI